MIGWSNLMRIKNYKVRWSTLVSTKPWHFLGFLRMHSTRHAISTSIIIEYYSPSEWITSRCVSLDLQPQEEWSNFKVASEMDLVKLKV